jgi:rhamnogalacturonyl hydrolase YesR
MMGDGSRRDFVRTLGAGAAIVVWPGTARAFGDASGNDTADGWARVPGILKRIVAPTFPARDFDVTTFGAVGDGSADCTAAFAKAVEACASQGGGRVVVPAGRYATGPIHLRSGVNLHVTGGATILFTRDPRAYLPAVLTRFEGTELYNYSPLIYALDQHGVAVTGEGTLDGQADATHWWPWKGSKEFGWVKGQPDYRAARARLLAMGEDNTPVEQRRFGEGDYLRSSFIQFYRCTQVLVEGVTIRNSPMWEIHPVLSTNVTVRRVTIESLGPNNDGCNPESCRDVLIEHCLFNTGDDCIAIKSGRNGDGRRVHAPTENVIVRHCQMRDGHGGVSIGSEISGDVRYVYVHDCRMDSPRLDRALRLKTNARRGGVLEHVYMKDVTVGEVADAVLTIDFYYEEGPNGTFPPTVRDIELRRVTSRKSSYGWYLRGFADDPIRNVRLADCTFSEVAKGNRVECVEGLALQRTRIAGPAAAPWSARIVDAAIARNPVVHEKWDYTAGLMLMAIQRVGDVSRRPDYGAYVRRNVDRLVQPDGSITTYRADEYNLDQVNEGRVLLTLFQRTRDRRYRLAADRVREQLRTHPRTPEGGFWHKKIYPEQMWLDGLYMAEPFYAEYARRFGAPADFDDVTSQFLLVQRHLRDARTGLYYHAWDSARVQPWADKSTGLSRHFWGRAVGWFMMAIVDVLDVLPASHRDRPAMLAMLRDLAAAVARVQDAATGLWWQVLDQPGRAGNYLEASASAMFTYALGKGARLGYLDAKYRRLAQLGFDGMVGTLVVMVADGRPSLTGVCKVAGLGGNPPRDGSYEYYVSEPVVADDYKGVGPFILAALELKR